LLEVVSTVEPVQDGRIHIEINGPFLFQDKGSPAEYGAGMKLAIERGWLAMHESGTLCASLRLAPICSLKETPSECSLGRGLSSG
jgi:hypothetical protein